MIGAFIEMVQNNEIYVSKQNTFTGYFTLVKQGMSYSIKPLNVEEITCTAKNG